MNYYQQKIIRNLLGRNYYFYFAIALTVAIITGSLISVENVIVAQVQFSDKIVHAFAYCLLTLNWLLAYKPKSKKLRFSLLISVIVFVYGIVIEVLQGALTTYRQADLLDVFANLGGIVIAFIFFNLIFRRN